MQVRATIPQMSKLMPVMEVLFTVGYSIHVENLHYDRGAQPKLLGMQGQICCRAFRKLRGGGSFKFTRTV